MANYFWRILVWIDQGVNVIASPLLNWLFPPAKFGNPDETLTSVFGKNQEQCEWCRRICKLLHIIDKDHCKKGIEHDE